jgi:prevent-host-death family protein
MNNPTPTVPECVTAYEAKTHLPKLLERTAKGQCFVITRHGKPVAQLIPFDAGNATLVCQAIVKVATIRARLSTKRANLADPLEHDETARELLHSGHRY